MKAAIISIGDEIVSGHIADTNSAFLSKVISERGCVVTAHYSVPDDVRLVAKSIKAALHECDVVVLTGGLGPTHDDITFEAIAVCLRRKLKKDRKALVWLRAFFRSRGVAMAETNVKQCLLPQGALALKNPV